MRFKNYRNKYNNQNRIYSEDDVFEMTLGSIFDNENDLLAQNREIGIPTVEELQNSPNTKWIEPYTDEQGNNGGNYWESIMDDMDNEYQYNSKESFVSNNNILSMNDKITTPVLESRIEQNHTIPAPQQQSDKNIEQPYMLEGRVEQNNTPTSFWENLYLKYGFLTPGAAIQKAAAKLPIWKSSEKEYYQHALKRADGEEPTDFMKEQNDFYKLDEISDPELKQIYIDKAAKMYGLDINDPATYDAIKNTEVVIPKIDSQLYSQIKKSETLQKWAAEYYDDIKNNANKSDSLAFPSAVFNNDKRANFATIHNTDLKNAKINEDGSLSVLLSDGYDFDKMNNKTKNLFSYVLKKVNNNAYKQQELGQLKRYLLSTQINYTKEEVDEILRKYKRLYAN